MEYLMPAEWEPHEATWLSWPKDPATFPPEILPQVEQIYLRMISALSKGEKVNVLVNDETAESRVMGMLEEAGSNKNVFLRRIPSVDVWMRDYGPIFVRGPHGSLKPTKWAFNAWGGKYSELMKDDAVADAMLRTLGVDALRPGIILEGGSIDVNGRGTLLTTEQCLLNKNRNSGLSRKQIEGYLGQYLGASTIIWLKEGIAGDDTDGHVDDIARFVDPASVLCAYEEDKSDENYAILKRNLDMLRKARTQDDEPLEVKALPMPGLVGSTQGRLPASYANFYIGNRVVLLPVFGHRNDETAISILQDSFPGREVVPIQCAPLVYGLGAIHCVTQQPA